MGGGGRQRDLDAEPAFRASVEIEAAVVRGGDGGDDREPEPVAVLRSGPVLAEAFERLGELRDGGLVEHRAGAVDDHSRPRSVEVVRALSSIEPPGWLWRTAFSITFSIIRREQRGAAGDLDRGEMRSRP